MWDYRTIVSTQACWPIWRLDFHVLDKTLHHFQKPYGGLAPPKEGVPKRRGTSGDGRVHSGFHFALDFHCGDCMVALGLRSWTNPTNWLSSTRISLPMVLNVSFFCCDCLSVKVTQSVCSVLHKIKIHGYTNPFNWGEARIAGETNGKCESSKGPSRNTILNWITDQKQRNAGVAHHGNQAPPGQVPRDTGPGKNSADNGDSIQGWMIVRRS